MNDILFASITKYLEEGIVPKDKDIKEKQVYWKKLIKKYRLTEGSLVLKEQTHRKIISKS